MIELFLLAAALTAALIGLTWRYWAYEEKTQDYEHERLWKAKVYVSVSCLLAGATAYVWLRFAQHPDLPMQYVVCAVVALWFIGGPDLIRHWRQVRLARKAREEEELQAFVRWAQSDDEPESAPAEEEGRRAARRRSER